MRFVFGYAGIPATIYDQIYSRRAWISGDSGEFFSKPYRLESGGYGTAYRNYFLKSFYDLIVLDHNNDLRDTGFALIYVSYPGVRTMEFVSKFFPSFLCIPIEWSLNSTNGTTIRQSKNQLLNLLKVATDQAKNSIPAVKKEINERESRTPLLLPVRNFRSDCFELEVRNLQNNLPRVRDKRSAIEEVIENIERTHPLLQVASQRRSFFVDDGNVEFHPPGRDRHGFARAVEGHPYECLLSGRRRLGAPYGFAFHYDCIRSSGALRGLFFGCHEDASIHTGVPHLNIAPNDFVRP